VRAFELRLLQGRVERDERIARVKGAAFRHRELVDFRADLGGEHGGVPRDELRPDGLRGVRRRSSEHRGDL
jgi:hypothetical protein